MIFIFLHSGMGNQMFQYAFGRLVEKERNVNVYFLCKKKDFKLNGFEGINYIELSCNFISFCFRISKKFKLRYYEFLSCLNEISIYSIPNYSLIVGYFQSSTLIDQNKSFVKELFKPKNFEGLNSKVCTVHIRRGDYLTTFFHEINSSALLPEDWFLNQIRFIADKYPTVRFRLIGDDKDFLYSFAIKISDLVECYSGNEMDDFCKLIQSKYLIISNSSFAWWGAFLNINEDVVVIAPKNWVGFSRGIEYPKGIMTSEFLWR